jgi:hypothetical protein
MKSRIKRRGGNLDLVVPPSSAKMPAWWHLIRRLWSQIAAGSIKVTPHPKGPWGTRRYSARIRRSVFSITGGRS